MHSGCAGLSSAEAECIRSASRKINFFCDNCNIVATINTLKDEINNLKTELENLKITHKAGINNILSEEDIVGEVEERFRRANCLILSNLPESIEDTANRRKDDDLVRCREIILKNSPDAKILSSTRLGKYDDSKTRPLKIVLENNAQALNILRTYKRNGNFYLNRDLTPRQQNHCYEVRKEYRRRKQLNENGIVLKYRNGIPKILNIENLDQKNM